MGGMIALAAALMVVCVILGMKLHRTQKAQRQLAERAVEFLVTCGKPLEVSTEEGGLAQLHNAILELENRSLLSEERRIEENRRASNLTADISHQLKTPLASLKLYCEMDAGAHVEQELQQIERMERLIHALLRLEKLSADGYSFTFAERDLRGIVMEAWQGLEGGFSDKRVRITGDATVRCDAVWMNEAIGNLLKNACEHTRPDGCIWVNIEPSDTAVFLSVEDDGGGVEPDELGRLFERFYRAKGGDSTGSGLGLSIAREIVRHHHGTIHAENTIHGLKIIFSIPIFNLAKS